MKTPLWDALKRHVASDAQSFHTPGHKNGRLVPDALRDAWGSALWRYDATEIPGLDNLAHPSGVLAQSMASWAMARGAAAVRYSLSGTSIGLKAALYGLCQNEEVFVPRHAHSSIYQGLVLAGAKPIFLPVRFAERLHIPLGVAIEDFVKAAEAHPTCKRMVVVHPTYHGITGENAALFAEARARDVLTIVDAAHGAHFAELDGVDDALMLGGDVVIESAHKTLPCMTQASVMLIRDAAQVEILSAALALVHTTSPSYVLMASLEAAGAWLHHEGAEVMQEGYEKIAQLEAALTDCDTLHIERHANWHQDPFKLYLTSPRVSGETIGALLAERGLVAEMTDGAGCLLLLGLDGGDETLVQTLLEVAQAIEARAQEAPVQPCYADQLPEMAVDMKTAWLAPRHNVPLAKAEGCVAAEIFEAYPPGIPLLLPGMRVTAAIIEAWLASGRDGQTPLAVLS